MEEKEIDKDVDERSVSASAFPAASGSVYKYVGRRANKTLFPNGHGQTAKKLCTWDMLEWANAVLGRSGDRVKGIAGIGGGRGCGGGIGGSSVCASLTSSASQYNSQMKNRITR